MKMSKSRFGHRVALIACLTFGLSVLFTTTMGCQGDTDGGDGAEFAAPGDQFVSNGGAGARLELDIGGDDNIIQTAQRESFSVRAYDPQGAPLPYIRIFCESEKGIAILSPSSGGVAFAHTSADGHMSGEIGGLYEGSYILECRAPEGFNLVVLMLVIIKGEVPEGFTGWEGAAGGNIGGGLIVDAPGQDVQITNIVIVKVGDSADNEMTHLDIYRNCCVPPSGNKIWEPYGYDDYKITIANGRNVRVFVNDVTFEVIESGASSTKQFNGAVIEPNSVVTLTGPLTDFGSGFKTWAGSSSYVSDIDGTASIIFTVTGEGGDDEGFSVTGTLPITVGDVNNCAAGYSASAAGACYPSS